MAMLDELADYLETAGCGTKGTVLFMGERPDSPDTILTVAAYPGNTPEYIQESYLPTWERPQIQVVARAVDYVVAEALADLAWGALAVITNADLGATRYRSVRPNGSPGLIGRDASNRPLIGFNASVVRRVTVGISS